MLPSRRNMHSTEGDTETSEGREVQNVTTATSSKTGDKGLSEGNLRKHVYLELVTNILHLSE